eukprot:4650938-Amphidinium_carterae.1
MSQLSGNVGQWKLFHGRDKALLVDWLVCVVWMVTEDLGFERDPCSGNAQVSCDLLLQHCQGNLSADL